MAQHHVTPNLDWPRWNWPTMKWFLSAGAGAIAVIGYLVPNYPRLSLDCRLALIAATVLAAVVCFFGQYCWRCAATAWRRIRKYGAVAANLELARSDLMRAASRLRRLGEQCGQWPKYHPRRAEFRNGDIYLRLSQDENADLGIGDELQVFDTESEAIVGRFCVSDIESGEYIAGPGRDVSAVWTGYYAAEGLHNAELPANFVVIGVSTFEKGIDDGL